jgi:hypothetical protein
MKNKKLKNDPLLRSVKTIKLEDLITDDQTKDIWKIMDEHPDPIKRVKALTEYLQKLREGLEAKGVLPEYLAYVIEAQRMFQLGARLSKKPE